MVILIVYNIHIMSFNKILQFSFAGRNDIKDIKKLGFEIAISYIQSK